MSETGEHRAGCFFAGHQYSDGALVCQSGKLLRCNDGQWQDTGDLCDESPVVPPPEQEQRILWYESDKVLITTVVPGSEVIKPRSQSEAKVCDYGPGPTVISPKITITNANISVRHWATGSAYARATYLNGTGGEYSFGAGGDYRIQPGTYDHKVLGNIVVGAGAHGGCIISQITYE